MTEISFQHCMVSFANVTTNDDVQSVRCGVVVEGSLRWVHTCNVTAYRNTVS